MALDLNDKALIRHLQILAVKTKAAIEAAVSDLPTTQFLDQTKTQFVQSFSFNASTYAGATNPNLEGKPVLVLALKVSDGSTESTSYSFLNMETLVSTYSVKDTATKNALNIAGYEIELKIDSSEDNLLEVTSEGLKVVAKNITGKADLVSGATNGNLAGLDANGNLKDSGVAASSVMMKATNVTAGNIAKFNVDGSVEDTGISVNDLAAAVKVASDSDVTAMLDEVFGAE